MTEEITLKSIKDVHLYNPFTDEEDEIKKIDYIGDDNSNIDINENELVQERIDDDWVIRGITAKVAYDGLVFEVTVSGSQAMGYAKVEDIGDYQKGKELMNKLRSKFMDNFRVYS